MGEPIWLVEEKIFFSPKKKPDYREIYIRLLEQVIAALREKQVNHCPLDGGPEKDHPSYHLIYDMPTIIMARVDRNPSEDSQTIQLVCYRDRQDYHTYLREYGDIE